MLHGEPFRRNTRRSKLRAVWRWPPYTPGAIARMLWLTNHLVNRMPRKMVPFNIYVAKTQLSKLIRQVRAGREVIIADAGTPVAKLVPIEQPKTARVLGGDRGKVWVAPDAFDPLAGEDLAAWDGALFPESPKRQQQPLTGRPGRRRELAFARVDEALARYARVHLDATAIRTGARVVLESCRSLSIPSCIDVEIVRA